MGRLGEPIRRIEPMKLPKVEPAPPAPSREKEKEPEKVPA